jgi:hypothetical protein
MLDRGWSPWRGLGAKPRHGTSLSAALRVGTIARLGILFLLSRIEASFSSYMQESNMTPLLSAASNFVWRQASFWSSRGINSMLSWWGGV